MITRNITCQSPALQRRPEFGREILPEREGERRIHEATVKDGQDTASDSKRCSLLAGQWEIRLAHADARLGGRQGVPRFS